MMPWLPKNSHLMNWLNSSLLLVAAWMVLRSSTSPIYLSRNSVRTTRPNSRNAKYNLFLRLAVPRRRRIVDGVILPALMDSAMRSDDLRLDAEHIKQAHQAQMIGLIASAMDAIVMLDDAQSIIAFNPSAEKMFGYARADILGSQLSKLLPQRFRTAHDAQLRAFGA